MIQLFFSGRSEYFKAMLHFQNIKQQGENESESEDEEDTKKQIVELKDIRPEIFTIIYNFIYTESAVVRISWFLFHTSQILVNVTRCPSIRMIFVAR